VKGHDLTTTVGSHRLKNPVIAAPGEHLIKPGGVMAAIHAGAGAVVVKSNNESSAAKAQLRAAEYVALDSNWNRIAWSPDTDPSATLLTRSGLHPLDFDGWLDNCVSQDRAARLNDCLLVPSLVLSQIDPAIRMAKQIEAAGLHVLEFNIGTPYASESARCAVATETAAHRVGMLTKCICDAVNIPVWVKLTGQSHEVPELAAAAVSAGAEATVIAGRLLGMVPDLATQKPFIGTSGGIGGYWNLPLTCHWLALSRAKLGPEKSIVGLNGAIGGADVARMMLAGAHAVGLSSAVMMRGFSVIEESIASLADYCTSHGMTAEELIGRAADARKSYEQMPELNDHWAGFVPDESS